MPRILKLFEGDELHRKKPLLGVEKIDRLLRNDWLCLRMLEVEMLNVRRHIC